MEELKKIIVDLNSVFEELIPIERNKLTAAADHNVVELEECMKREQVAILQLKGLDQRREALQQKHGWNGMSFRQLAETWMRKKRQIFSRCLMSWIGICSPSVISTGM